MRSAAAAALVLLSGCASWRAPAPGPTPIGLAVRVAARERDAARREALESVLPLFLTAGARREKAGAVDAVLAKPGAFVGRERVPKKGDGVVEMKIDALGAALRKTGAVVPPGFSSGPEVVLLAFGDRASGPDANERFTADAFEVALFGRGVQAQDADDQLLQLKRPIKAKTEADTVKEAADGGWAWLATGRVTTVARREPQTAAWRASAALSMGAYAIGVSTEPSRYETSGTAVDVSSYSALSRAMEQAAQEAAARFDGLMAKRRAGHATLAVLLTGRKDPAYVRRVIADLRRTPGVEGATVVAWRTVDEMTLIHAYATGLTVDLLAARLLHGDASLRVDAIETEDGRLTLQGPATGFADDTGGEAD